MGQPFGRDLVFPIKNATARRIFSRDEICPECGGELDTGWECVDCGFDASNLAYSDFERRMDKRWR